MSLNDRQHVEAVAIIRRLSEDPSDVEARQAAAQWLRENQPSGQTYLAALRDGARP